MISVEEILNDFDLCSPFLIVRKTGVYGLGGWVPNEPVTIQTIGAVRNTSGKELAMVPEADQVHELMTFRTVAQMYVTSAQKNSTSDILTYRGDNYRILTVKQYPEQGYWLAIATRMIGT